jgi:F0F1-type ATP synthase assembly protein I
MTDPAPPPPPPRKSSLSKFRDRFFGLSPRARQAADGRRAELVDSTRLATAGLELAGGILVFAALGWGLDTLVGTAPIFLIVGSLLGLTGGLYRLIKATQPPAPPRR